MKYVKGDILEGLFDEKTGEYRADKLTLILHGCNCFHTMGAGIALYLKKKFPLIYRADIKFGVRGDRARLGTITPTVVGKFLYVINCYSQYDHRYDADGNPPVDYNAIRNCLRAIKELYSGATIRTPKIGCGLAGGDWEEVKQIFEEELKGFEVVVFEL